MWCLNSPTCILRVQTTISQQSFEAIIISEEKLSVDYLEMKGVHNHLKDELAYKYCHREAVLLHCTVYVV